jgi:hypothetical protein
MCERPLKLFPCSRYTQPRPYHCTYACHCVVGLCVVAHDESHRSNATPYRGSRLAMPSRLVGAVLHKAIRVSGVFREFVCLCLSQSVRSRSQTLSCTWMRSFSPRTSPGVSSRYSLLYPFADISLLTYVRCIAPLPSGASVRRKTSCGCMGYGSVRHCALAASFDEISFSTFSPSWSASSCLFSSWSMRCRSGSMTFSMALSKGFPVTPWCTTEHSSPRLSYVFIRASSLTAVDSYISKVVDPLVDDGMSCTHQSLGLVHSQWCSGLVLHTP